MNPCFATIMTVQGHHGGQRLLFVDFILEIPHSFITAMPLLSIRQAVQRNGQLEANKPNQVSYHHGHPVHSLNSKFD